MTTDSMASNWFYAKRGDPSGQPTGPLAWERLYALVQAGTLTSDDLVWHQTFPNWVPAIQVTGLFPAAVAPAVQVPYQVPAPIGAAYGPMTQPMSAGRRRSWLFWVVPLVLVILVGASLGAYFGFMRHSGDGSTTASNMNTAASQSTSTSVATTTTTAASTTTSAASTTTSAASSTTTTFDPAAEITENWQTFFDSTTSAEDKVALLENGQQYASDVEAQANSAAYPLHAEVRSVSVDSPTTATVKYSFTLSATLPELQGTFAFDDMTGQAVLQDGVWKISAESFGELLDLEGGFAPAD